MVFEGANGSSDCVAVMDIWGDKLVGELAILEHDTLKLFAGFFVEDLVFD